MSLDSDYVLIGTGTAPLVAARLLLGDQARVLLLNPDHDFFLEDSELPLDPMVSLLQGLEPWTAATALERIQASATAKVLDRLRPLFPGALESWDPKDARENRDVRDFYDPGAPHLRSRSRLWLLNEASGAQAKQAELFDEIYVLAEDAGLHPQILGDLPALRRWPGAGTGAAGGPASLKGLLIPRLADFDVARFRTGLLEFVTERLGPERVVRSATNIELMPGGVRFYSDGAPRSARVSGGIFVFWTPRLTSWIQTLAKKQDLKLASPLGARLWEQWQLLSRDPIDPSNIGAHKDLVAWAELEGRPGADSPIHVLSLLRRGGLSSAQASDEGWLPHDSFRSISELLAGILHWDRVTVRSMRPRLTLEWKAGQKLEWKLPFPELRAWIFGGCDGPIFDVVETARRACDTLLKEQPA